MASKVLCLCGELIRIDLHEGNKVNLLVPEELMDVPESMSARAGGELVDRIIGQASVAAFCPRCGVLTLVDQGLGIKRYRPVD